jgi:hypothetical protein
MVRPEFQGAFEHCPWCHGRGCNQCPYERQKWMEANYGPDGLPKPIFEANPDDPHDMDLLKRVVGREALEHAFGPDGGGVAEIEIRAAEARLLQVIHKELKVFAHEGKQAGEQQRGNGSQDAGSPP